MANHFDLPSHLLFNPIPSFSRIAMIHPHFFKHLNMARIILLFISPDYVASEQNNTEVTRAMERHDAQEATIIPIILRPTAGWQDAPFGKIQSISRGGKAITE